LLLVGGRRVGFGLSLEPSQTGGPEAVDELLESQQPCGVRPVHPPGAVASLRDQVRRLQDAQMLGDRRPGYLKMRRDLTGR